MNLNMTSAATLAEIAGRRGRTYWLLARGFAEPPNRVLFGELMTELGPVDLAEPLGEETGALTDAIQAALGREGDGETLAIEFTRLFGGVSKSGGSLPPYESVVRTGQWGGETVDAVIAAYNDADIVPPLPEASPADHLAAELRFMAISCHRESEAWLAGDVQTALGWVRRERDFLDHHVLRWMPTYCATSARSAETAFYRALLVLTPRAGAIDREDIDIILETISPALAYA